MKYKIIEIVEGFYIKRGLYNKMKGWELTENENPDDNGYMVIRDSGQTNWIPEYEFHKIAKTINCDTIDNN